MASTWAPHVIAVEAMRCARREVHVQVERKDAGGHRARDWHTDGSAAAQPTVCAGHRTCATAVGKARSTPEGACFTTCPAATGACAAREVTFYLAVPSPSPSRPLSPRSLP